jgi:alkyl hydroperoxide reductase subunit AhpC
MAQLRQEYQQFMSRNAEILVVGTDDETAFKDYWLQEDLPGGF